MRVVVANAAEAPLMPLQLFGAQKRAALGLSTGSYSHQRRGTGFIYQSALVQSIPEEYRLKAQRTVSARCVLAIRMDINKSMTDGASMLAAFGTVFSSMS